MYTNNVCCIVNVDNDNIVKEKELIIIESKVCQMPKRFFNFELISVAALTKCTTFVLACTRTNKKFVSATAHMPPWMKSIESTNYKIMFLLTMILSTRVKIKTTHAIRKVIPTFTFSQKTYPRKRFSVNKKCVL